jgi:hypothetical protein
MIEQVDSNPHAKTPILEKLSKSSFTEVWHKDNLYLDINTIRNGNLTQQILIWE